MALPPPAKEPPAASEMSMALAMADEVGAPVVKMAWEVQPCYGFDVCGTWCGDGRGCESCGRCGLWAVARVLRIGQGGAEGEGLKGRARAAAATAV